MVLGTNSPSGPSMGQDPPPKTAARVHLALKTRVGLASGRHRISNRDSGTGAEDEHG